MRVTYQASKFSVTDIDTHYARKDIDGKYFVDDVDRKKLTIRTTEVPRAMLSANVAEECDNLQGQAFNSVRFKW